MRKKHLLIAGGGTGGHIAPAIAVGHRAEDFFKVSYACTPRPVDTLMYADSKNAVHVMNPPRVDKGMKLLLPFSAMRSFLDARKLLNSNRVDIVLGTGGYSSFFAIAAAWSLGIPAAIFDSNAISGRSNRMASRFCKIAFTGLSGGENGLNCPVIFTGTPVADKMKKTPAATAREEIGIDKDVPAILFLGGSQGAKAINDLAINTGAEVSILLQCGENDHQRVLQYSENQDNLNVKPFVQDLSLWYSAADLVVARSGGQTIAELSAFGLPAVFIPYPYAADDHQRANAAVIQSTGGALLFSQDEIESSDLVEKIVQLARNSEELLNMSTAMKSVFPSDPAENIITHLRRLI